MKKDSKKTQINSRQSLSLIREVIVQNEKEERDLVE